MTKLGQYLLVATCLVAGTSVMALWDKYRKIKSQPPITTGYYEMGTVIGPPSNGGNSSSGIWIAPGGGGGGGTHTADNYGDLYARNSAIEIYNQLSQMKPSYVFQDHTYTTVLGYGCRSLDTTVDRGGGIGRELDCTFSPGPSIVALDPVGIVFSTGEVYPYMAWGQSERVVTRRENQHYYSSAVSELDYAAHGKPFCHLDTNYSCADRYFEFMHSSSPQCKPLKGQFYVVVCIEGRIEYAIRYFSAELNGDRRQ